MGKYVRIIDETGLYIEDAFVEELTEFTIETQVSPDAGFYRPKWDGEKWSEGLNTSEIEAIQVRAEQLQPTSEERIEALEAALLELILGGST